MPRAFTSFPARFHCSASLRAVVGVLTLSVAPIVGLDAQQRARSADGGGDLARAVAEVERLDALRSSLARTFAAGGVAATDSTFAHVCKPVKMQAMQVAKEHGWTIAQLAERNRNAENVLDTPATLVFRAMQRDTALMGQWARSTMGGASGTRYFRRITVEASCLACHGARESRPQFVKERYPADRAFGFSVGDLRGVYSVFIPDSLRTK